MVHKLVLFWSHEQVAHRIISCAPVHALRKVSQAPIIKEPSLTSIFFNKNLLAKGTMNNKQIVTMGTGAGKPTYKQWHSTHQWDIAWGTKKQWDWESFGVKNTKRHRNKHKVYTNYLSELTGQPASPHPHENQKMAIVTRVCIIIQFSTSLSSSEGNGGVDDDIFDGPKNLFNCPLTAGFLCTTECANFVRGTTTFSWPPSPL